MLVPQSAVLSTERKPSLKTGTIIKAEKKENFSAVITIERKGVYYVRSYATNKYGTEYGEERSFEFLGLPAVTTLTASNLGDNTATLNGQIDFKGDPVYTERGFVYSRYFSSPTIDDPASSTTRIKVSGSSNEFSANVSGLTKDATYYVRAYAINSTDIVYGESVSFVASTPLPYYKLDVIGVQLSDLGFMGWDIAQTACKNSRVGGFSNWRVPTRAELSLVYTNRSIIGGFWTGKYWTSESYFSSNNNYYYVDFTGGSTNTTTAKANDYSVRCVRTL